MINNGMRGKKRRLEDRKHYHLILEELKKHDLYMKNSELYRRISTNSTNRTPRETLKIMAKENIVSIRGEHGGAVRVRLNDDWRD